MPRGRGSSFVPVYIYPAPQQIKRGEVRGPKHKQQDKKQTNKNRSYQQNPEHTPWPALASCPTALQHCTKCRWNERIKCSSLFFVDRERLCKRERVTEGVKVCVCVSASVCVCACANAYVCILHIVMLESFLLCTLCVSFC